MKKVLIILLSVILLPALSSAATNYYADYSMQLNQVSPTLQFTGENQLTGTSVLNRRVFAFVTEQNQLNRIIAINADDQVYNGIGGSQIGVVNYLYDEAKRLVVEAYYDSENQLVNGPYGFALVRYVYHPTKNQVTRYFFGTREEMKMVITPEFTAAAQTFTLDSHGRIMEIRNLKTDGSLYVNVNQPAITKYQRDAAGRITETRYFLDEDRLGYNPAKPAVIQREYDRRGKLTKLAFYDLNEQPLPIEEHRGSAVMQISYDRHGRVIERAYYRDETNLVDDPSGAREEYRYDRAGNIIYQASYNAAGELLPQPNTAIIRYQYDRHGNMLEKCFYNAEDQKMRDSEGVHCYRYQYDNNGRVVREEYLGLENQPVTIAGIKEVTYQYTNGQQIVTGMYNLYNRNMLED